MVGSTSKLAFVSALFPVQRLWRCRFDRHRHHISIDPWWSIPSRQFGGDPAAPLLTLQKARIGNHNVRRRVSHTTTECSRPSCPLSSKLGHILNSGVFF